MNDDILVLAKTLYGEARGESTLGRIAVAWVIINRRDRQSWPNTIKGVCLQPWQFSCWNQNDPNSDLINRLTVNTNNAVWKDCMAIAEDVATNQVPDPTNGADHYHALWMLTGNNQPQWSRGKAATATIGNHVFFNLTGTVKQTKPEIKPIMPTTNDRYFLDFVMHFDRDKGLDQGRLVLRSVEGYTGRTLNIWVATSSVINKQQPESFHQRGGLIPPEYRVPNLKSWSVETKPINLGHVRGVEGSFYKILPFEVKTDKGGVRSDFGIHLDANVPGSLGCIVMEKARFADFEVAMTKLASQGVKVVPLFVTYS